MKKKVFIIEDDVNILYGLQAKFGLAGMESQACGINDSSREIINDLHKFKPDLIILDMILPNADGFEILKAIRKEEDLKGTTAFIFTNLSDRDSKERSSQLGYNNYFSKSDLNVDQFIEKVLKIIANKSKINA